MMRKAILFLLAGSLFAAEPGVKWETSLEAAQARARAEHKLILMDVWTEWCGWCIKLQKDTFPTPVAQAALAKVVPLSLKTQLAHGEPTAQAYIEKQYQVDGFPALIMLDADGKVVARQPGYMPGQPFADWVNKVAAGRR